MTLQMIPVIVGKKRAEKQPQMYQGLGNSYYLLSSGPDKGKLVPEPALFYSDYFGPVIHQISDVVGEHHEVVKHLLDKYLDGTEKKLLSDFVSKIPENLRKDYEEISGDINDPNVIKTIQEIEKSRIESLVENAKSLCYEILDICDSEKSPGNVKTGFEGFFVREYKHVFNSKLMMDFIEMVDDIGLRYVQDKPSTNFMDPKGFYKRSVEALTNARNELADKLNLEQGKHFIPTSIERQVLLPE